MRKLIFYLVLSTITYATVAQGNEATLEEIEALKRFEKVKKQFLNKQYQQVLDYYDSISNKSNFVRLETYKMVNESCLELIDTNSEDSLYHTNLANSSYQKAIKWYGKMQIEERWDSIEIGLNKESEVYKMVDQTPEFPGGMAALYKYLGQELKYPEEARKMGIEGRVFVQFVVNKDGSIDAVNTIKGIGSGCDLEAERVIANAPDFTPGMQGGKPVYVRMVMPVVFKLSNDVEKKKKKKRGN